MTSAERTPAPEMPRRRKSDLGGGEPSEAGQRGALPPLTIGEKLRRLSVSFNVRAGDAPATFLDLLRFLSDRSGIPIDVAPESESLVAEQDADITMRLDHLRLGAALDLVLTMKGLDYVVEGGRIVVRAREPAYDVRTDVYRIRELLAIPADAHAAPRPRPPSIWGDPLPELPGPQPPFTPKQLVNAIKRDVAPHTWNTLSRVNAKVAGGKLIITNFPAVHREVEGYLALLEELSVLPLMVEVRAFACSVALLDALPIGWRYLEAIDERPRINAVRAALLSPGEQAALGDALGAPVYKAPAQRVLNFQRAGIDLLRLVEADPAPEQLPSGAVAAGMVAIVEPRLRPQADVVGLTFELDAADVRPLPSGALSQWRYRARGRIDGPLSHAVLLRDLPDVFGQPAAGPMRADRPAEQTPEPRGNATGATKEAALLVTMRTA